MIFDSLLFWVLVGSITAILNFKFQQWTVGRLNPSKINSSIFLVIAGAVLRWLLFVAVLVFSIAYSYKALLTVFLTFLIIRFVFLLKWQGWLQIKNLMIRGT
jgi:hypothetical protein